MTTTKNKIFSLFLALFLMLALILTLNVIAAAEDGACSHGCGDGSCAYVGGVDCAYTHEHDDACGYDEEAANPCADVHQHDEFCGYTEAVACDHVCDEACGGLTVDEPEDMGGTITEFAPLAEDIRFQRGYMPNLPTTLAGTVNGKAADIPVTWYAEGYDAENYTGSGLFAFIAEVGEGYTLNAGAPTIAYFKLPLITPLMGGSGTSSKPLEITNAAQLAEIAALVNEGKLESTVLGNSTGQVYLQLQNDIDLAAYSSGAGWIPIGTDTKPFKGSFDGKDNVITGLYINRSVAGSGLFGVINGGTVKNLGILGANITGGDHTGGVVGAVSSSGSVEKCYFTGSVLGTMQVGGVAGQVFNSGSEVTNCYATGSVSGTDNNVGGVVGVVSDFGSVTNCYATGSVSGEDSVGGVAGDVSQISSVTNCAALNPSVEATGAGSPKVGRVVGSNDSGNLTNNVAFDKMVVMANSSPKTLIVGDDKVDGADLSVATITGDGTIGNRFTTGWTTDTGKLPILTGVGGPQDDTMPWYIDDGYSGNFFAGAGTNISPFQISTAADLAKLAELVNADATYNAGANHYNVADYELTGPIDLSAYGAGAGWEPIGDNNTTLSTSHFNGHFDGGGHVITGLFINRSTDYQGLFGVINRGTVQNLGIVGANITGKEYVGGVAGLVQGAGGASNYGVSNCFVSGSGSGTFRVGGVAGRVTNGAKLQSCYSNAIVNGTEDVGGVVGNIYGTSTSVSYCFVSGSVSGTIRVGGVAGQVSTNANVNNCAALNESVTGTNSVGRVVGGNINIISNNVAFSGMTIMVDGIPKSPVGDTHYHIDGESKTADEINAAGFWGDTNFTSAWDTSIWTITPNKLPGLFGVAVEMPYHLLEAPYFGGTGADLGQSTNPYEISTPAQLAKLAQLVNADNATTPVWADKHYKLMNDIDLSAYSYGAGWTPIGTGTNRFKGHFDGGNNVISGLYISRSVQNTGLFGYIDDGTVQNLGLQSVNITGYNYVGGVAGYVYDGGSVSNCYAIGSVTGTGNYVGGVAGYADDSSSISNCYATTSVTGTDFVGGVAGYVFLGSTVQNCYATGSVIGRYAVGGVAGVVDGSSVNNCAALNPSVKGTTNVGRVVGENLSNTGILTNNYAFSGMTVTVGANPKDPLAKGVGEIDGADVTVANANSTAFWSGTMNWNSTSIWTFEANKLPILTGLAGQTGDTGLYLTDIGTPSVTNYTISVSASPAAGGTVSGGGTFTAGSNRTVTATANSGYSFKNWTAGGTQVSTSAAYTFTLSGNRTLVANFESTGGTTPPTGGGGGGGGSSTPSSKITSKTNTGGIIKGGSVTSGGKQTFTITPAEGYEIEDVLVDGKSVGAVSSYTFDDATKNKHTIEAKFRKIAEQQPAYKPMTPIHSPGTVVEATKTNNPLLLDGQATQFPAVKISGYNWLKLRDFAALLAGTSKQFSISYDAQTGIIDINTGAAYAPLGDELTDTLNEIENATASLQRLRVNGQFIDIAAYNINGYNYFRLRDLAIILDFAVIYDEASGVITLDLTNPYSE